MLGEHHLRVVAWRSIAPRHVISNQVTLPLHAAGVHVHQKWRITGHHDDVTVALHSSHPGSITQCRAEVWCRRAFACSPFANKYLWTAAIGFVVMSCVVEEFGGAAVIMIVDYIRANTFDRGRGNDLQIRILRLDCFVKLLVSSIVTSRTIEVVL